MHHFCVDLIDREENDSAYALYKNYSLRLEKDYVLC